MSGDRAHTEAGSRTDLWLGLGLGCAFLLLYLRTLCPTVYLGDVGDFCTAIATGGVAHPPGYPLFSLLGRIALELVPHGEPAYRIGCVVALAAALAVVALYFLIREIGASPWAAGVAAATFGASYTFWNQSTRVEVYSLHLLLVALLLLAALRYRRTGRLIDLAAAVLAGSLGLAHHLTIVLLGPALLLLCVPRLWRDAGRGRRLALLIALLPVGPLLYLLLLGWARTEPLHSWGRTVDFPLLWNHASARIYRGMLQWPQPEKLAARLGDMGRFFLDNFPWLLCLLPLAGLGRLWLLDRRLAAALLLTAGIIGAYNLCYLIDDIAPYYLPLWLIGAALIGVALEGLRAMAHRVHHPRLVGALLALLPVLLLLRNWSACDLSRSTWVRDFARHKLEHAPPGSVLITQGDHDRFPIWYAHDVLKIRPDVIPVDRVFLNDGCLDQFRDPSQWYLHRLRRQGVDAPLLPDSTEARLRLAGDRYLICLITDALKDRPLCITFGDTADSLALDQRVFFRWAAERYTQVPHGLLLRYNPRSRPVRLRTLVQENDRLWSTVALPDMQNVRMDQDLDPGYVRQHYACMLVNYGGLREMAGDLRGATAIYRRVIDWAPDYQPALRALASLQRSKSAHARPQSRDRDG